MINLLAPYRYMRWPYLVFKSQNILTCKGFENEEKDIEMPYNITRDGLAHMAKRIKKVMKFDKKFHKNQESEIGKGPEQ